MVYSRQTEALTPKFLTKVEEVLKILINEQMFYCKFK